jgi:hypothetical protein
MLGEFVVEGLILRELDEVGFTLGELCEEGEGECGIEGLKLEEYGEECLKPGELGEECLKLGDCSEDGLTLGE